jgi:hypothetical protein
MTPQGSHPFPWLPACIIYVQGELKISDDVERSSFDSLLIRYCHPHPLAVPVSEMALALYRCRIDKDQPQLTKLDAMVRLLSLFFLFSCMGLAPN